MIFFLVQDTHIPHRDASEMLTPMLIALAAILKNNLMTSEEIPFQITCHRTGNHQVASRNTAHHFLRLNNVLSSNMACWWPQRAVNLKSVKGKHLSPLAIYTCLPAKILRELQTT